MRRLLLLPAFALVTGRLPAQTAAPVTQAAETITAADVARHIGVIADDSMMGRDTPSRGLELTAQYVADQFKTFGLKAGGDNGTWLQRYPTPGGRQVDFAQSRLLFTAGGKEAAAGFTTAAYFGTQTVPEQLTSAGAVVVAGQHTAESLKKANVQDKIVLYIAPAGGDATGRPEVLSRLAAVSKGLVVLSDQDSASFAAHRQAALTRNLVAPNANAVLAARMGMWQGPEPSWTVYVRPEAIQNILATGGVDLARARADTNPVVQELPKLTVRLALQAVPVMVPNTVGIIEGSDPKLKHEYIVFTAHMDHKGITSGQQPDSILNGADDNASGTAGIIELAEAFSRPDARPRRSLIFVAVSGEEKGLWGSGYFIKHPPVPIEQFVANVNLDMIGRKWADTIKVQGKSSSDLGATLDRVVAAHPELRMTPVSAGSGFGFESDQYYFAQKEVPVLYFENGTHEDYHAVTDSPEKINTEKEARLLRLVFYVGHEVANADQRPQWGEEARQRFQQRAQQP